jgi:hypothetical protein
VADLTAGWRHARQCLRPLRDVSALIAVLALRFNGRKRVHDADKLMAQITAERLVEHLKRSGYVVMHKPPLGQHGAPGNLAGWIAQAIKLQRGE